MKKITDYVKIEQFSIAKLKPVMTVLVIFVVGFGAGSLVGDFLIENYITGSGRLLLLITRPGYEYISVSNMLNSSNEVERLSGYYSLLDNKKIDTEFLIERYRREQAISNKRTIIWLLGYSKDRIVALKFFAREFKNSSNRIKKEILGSMKKISSNYFYEFIKEKKVDKRMIENILEE